MSSKLADISLKYDTITIFKMAVVCHLGFQILKVFKFTRHYSRRSLPCIFVQNFVKIIQSAAELSPETMFSF